MSIRSTTINPYEVVNKFDFCDEVVPKETKECFKEKRHFIDQSKVDEKIIERDKKKANHYLSNFSKKIKQPRDVSSDEHVQTLRWEHVSVRISETK